MKKFPVLWRVVLGRVISAMFFLGAYASAAITTCCWPDGTCADIDSAICAANAGTTGGSYARCATSACPTALLPIRVLATTFAPPQNMTIQWESHVGVKYTVLWGSNLNSITTPLGTKIGPDHSITDFAATDSKRFYRVRYERPAPTPEACCFFDGSCTDINASLCVSQSGTPQGPGTTCATTSCPQPPTEACCFPDDNSCSDGSASMCSLYGGTPQGPGTNCSSVFCLPQGDFQACCFPDASCSPMPADVCWQQGGVPQGVGSSCFMTPCQPPLAACCLSDGSCIDMPYMYCYQYGGTPQMDMRSCSSAFCMPQEIGACCFPDQTCTMMSSNECFAWSGMPRGSGTSCYPGICSF